MTTENLLPTVGDFLGSYFEIAVLPDVTQLAPLPPPVTEARRRPDLPQLGYYPNTRLIMPSAVLLSTPPADLLSTPLASLRHCTDSGNSPPTDQS